MFTTKMRAVAAIALAATAALAVAGGAQAGPVKPNAADPGDVQLLTTDGNASLVHTIRHADGSWQHFGRIDGYTGVVGLTSTLLGGEENVFFQYTGPKGLQLAHFIRHADGTWNFNAATPAFDSAVDGFSATVVDGKIVLLQLKGGAVQVSTQGTDGRWSQWAAVPSNGLVRSVAAAGTGATLHVVELSMDGKTVTDFDQSDGSTWGSGSSQPTNTNPDYLATEVAAAADWGNVQVALIEEDRGYGGAIYHSILHSYNGSWDGFAPIAPEIGNSSTAAHVAMTPWRGQMQLVFSTPTGDLFHTIRDYNGKWAGAGNVESVAGNVTAGQVTIASYVY